MATVISYWNPCVWLAESKFVSENHWWDASWNLPLDQRLCFNSSTFMLLWQNDLTRKERNKLHLQQAWANHCVWETVLTKPWNSACQETEAVCWSVNTVKMVSFLWYSWKTEIVENYIVMLEKRSSVQNFTHHLSQLMRNNSWFIQQKYATVSGLPLHVYSKIVLCPCDFV